MFSSFGDCQPLKCPAFLALTFTHNSRLRYVVNKHVQQEKPDFVTLYFYQIFIQVFWPVVGFAVGHCSRIGRNVTQKPGPTTSRHALSIWNQFCYCRSLFLSVFLHARFSNRREQKQRRPFGIYYFSKVTSSRNIDKLQVVKCQAIAAGSVQYPWT